MKNLVGNQFNNFIEEVNMSFILVDRDTVKNSVEQFHIERKEEEKIREQVIQDTKKMKARCFFGLLPTNVYNKHYLWYLRYDMVHAFLRNYSNGRYTSNMIDIFKNELEYDELAESLLNLCELNENLYLNTEAVNFVLKFKPTSNDQK